ncbi:hypothetical protein BRC66_01385, partial [Halobacteriales archaeon QH_2_66_30]
SNSPAAILSISSSVASTAVSGPSPSAGVSVGVSSGVSVGVAAGVSVGVTPGVGVAVGVAVGVVSDPSSSSPEQPASATSVPPATVRKARRFIRTCYSQISKYSRCKFRALQHCCGRLQFGRH